VIKQLFLAREQKNSGKKFFLFIKHEVLFYVAPFLHRARRNYLCGATTLEKERESTSELTTDPGERERKRERNQQNWALSKREQRERKREKEKERERERNKQNRCTVQPHLEEVSSSGGSSLMESLLIGSRSRWRHRSTHIRPM
jgi:hypothetical protein